MIVQGLGFGVLGLGFGVSGMVQTEGRLCARKVRGDCQGLEWLKRRVRHANPARCQELRVHEKTMSFWQQKIPHNWSSGRGCQTGQGLDLGLGLGCIADLHTKLGMGAAGGQLRPVAEKALT